MIIEFEEWAEKEGYDLNKVHGRYTHSDTRDVFFGWRKRQSEIDDLIHDNDNFRKAIVEYDKENAALKAEIAKLKVENEQYAQKIQESTDKAIDYMLATSKHIGVLNDEIERLKAEVDRLNSALMRDAISDIQNVERVEVFPVYTQDDKLRKAAEKALIWLEQPEFVTQQSRSDVAKSLRQTLEKLK